MKPIVFCSFFIIDAFWCITLNLIYVAALLCKLITLSLESIIITESWAGKDINDAESCIDG